MAHLVQNSCVLALICSALFSGGSLCLAKFARSHADAAIYLASAIFLLSFGNAAYVLLVRSSASLTYVTLASTAASIAIMTFCSWAVFGEQITFKHLIAVVLSIAAVFIISLPKGVQP